jgi:two-component system response regulator FixJ
MSSERSLHEKSMGLHPAPKVYVVDDDGSIRFAMQTLMESIGIGVETFATAEAFLESFRREYAGCLVLDIHMPGMSGLDVQEILRQKEVSIPIICFTAQGSVPIAVHAIKKGADVYVTKPFGTKELLEQVKRLLGEFACSLQRSDFVRSLSSRYVLPAYSRGRTVCAP